MTPFSAAKVVAPPLVCSVFSEALRAREEPLECCCSPSSVARLDTAKEVVTRLALPSSLG